MTSVEEASRAFVKVAEHLPALYVLSGEWLETAPRLDAAEGDDEATSIEAVLDGIEGDIRRKAENIIGLSRWFDTLAAARRAEVARIEEGARLYERRAERLRKYVMDAMHAIGIDRIDTSKYSLSVRKNPVSVAITNPDAIPPELLRERIIREPNKTAIRTVIQAGHAVPGAELQQTERLEVR